VSDGRSEPRNPKKRNARPDEARRSGAGRARSGSEGSRADREPRREAPEPGFGPFKREGRPGDRQAGGRKRGDDEARAVRSVAEEAVARASGDRKPSLRIVHGTAGGDMVRQPKGAPAKKAKGAKRGAPAGAPAVQRPRPVRDGVRLQEALVRGARALERGYEQEALRILRPYREPHPDSADLRELLGVAYYRIGKWSMAQKELEAYVALTGSTEQHPVLMDCARALGRFNRVEELWEELRAVSPGAEIVTEGRIVAAGALADRGRMDQAIKLLERAPANPRRILPHHLRLWYALADLHERAGDLPAARTLFRRVSAEDPAFVDVAERLAALS
jgi:thioredoxin-like negative regulator of GroEL